MEIIRVVSKSEERTAKNGQKFKMFLCVLKSDGNIVTVYDYRTSGATAEKDTFCILKNAKRASFGLTIHEKTKVFPDSGEFDYDEDAVERFLRPPVVPLDDVRQSPTKRRLSVRGTVTGVGEVESYPSGSKKRVLCLDDKINVKAWGAFADLEVRENDSVTVYNVEVDEWNETKSLQTFIGSSIEVSDVSSETTATIIGRNEVELISDDGTVFLLGDGLDVSHLKIPRDVLLTIDQGIVVKVE